MFKISNEPYRLTPERHDQLCNVAGEIKLISGVANNMAVLVMSHAVGEMKKAGLYKFRVKGYFKRAIEAFNRYEQRLKYQSAPRFFHLPDLPESTRSKYGPDITDEDYYEFWCGLGGGCYAKVWPFVTCLQHKYFRMMQHMGIKCPEQGAWAMVANVMLEIACQLWRTCIDGVQKETPDIPPRLLNTLFGSLSMQTVLDRWQEAMFVLMPEFKDNFVTEEEHRNAELTLRQICEMMGDPLTMYDASIRAMNDFSDIFASQKALKDAIKVVKREKQKLLEE